MRGIMSFLPDHEYLNETGLLDKDGNSTVCPWKDQGHKYSWQSPLITSAIFIQRGREKGFFKVHRGIMAKLDFHYAAASSFGFHGPTCAVKGKVLAQAHHTHSPTTFYLSTACLLCSALLLFGSFAFCELYHRSMLRLIISSI